MRLSIIIFDGFTTLDIVGGYEVLARIPGMEVEFVAKRRGIVAADTRRLGLVAYRALSEVTSTDILYLPGGPGGLACEQDEELLSKLRELDATSSWTVGICNGVGILAAAGLLSGKKAATNWFYQERLREHGVEFVAERYHREGKYITGGGVSASLDTALFLASMLGGELLAKAIQLGIEYYPDPPFSERSPAEAPAAVQEVVRHYDSGGGAGTMARQPPWETMPEFARA